MRFLGRSSRSSSTTSRKRSSRQSTPAIARLRSIRSPTTPRRAIFYISHTRSGGVSVNDAIQHVAQHDLPFGGVGASGMGFYHGWEGFQAFSKLRPVFQQGRIALAQTFLQPPYTRFSRRVVAFMTRLKS